MRVEGARRRVVGSAEDRKEVVQTNAVRQIERVELQAKATRRGPREIVTDGKIGCRARAHGVLCDERTATNPFPAAPPLGYEP